MSINWRTVAEDPPYDGQTCLTKMKHGLISGDYNADENCFYGYYWKEMSWWATYWVPIDEVDWEK